MTCGFCGTARYNPLYQVVRGLKRKLEDAEQLITELLSKQMNPGENPPSKHHNSRTQQLFGQHLLVQIFPFQNSQKIVGFLLIFSNFKLKTSQNMQLICPTIGIHNPQFPHASSTLKTT
jgi:hypothetical protein